MLVDIQKSYEIKIHEARLNSYPLLYELLSDFIKSIDFMSTTKQPITKTSVTQLFDQINKWDSKHAIHFSDRCAPNCYNYRQYLWRLISDIGEGSEQKPLPSETVNLLREETARFEHQLKTDLAIYGIQESDSGFGLREPGRSQDTEDRRLVTEQLSPSVSRLTSRAGGRAISESLKD